MKCENCGEENLEGASFCKKCGNDFKKEEVKLIEIEKIEENETNEESKNKEKEKIETENNSDKVALYCQCGQKIESGWEFCPNCKAPVTFYIKNINGDENSTNQKSDNAIIYIALYFISLASGFIFNFGICYLVTLLIAIAGVITYPKNKIIKILFWIILMLFIIFAFYILWLVITCANALDSCSNMG